MACESPHQIMNEWTQDPRELLDTFVAAIKGNMLCYSIWAGNYALVVPKQAREILKLRDRLNEVLAHHTGRPVEQISRDSGRDYYMSGEEARAYGLVDQVVAHRPAPGAGRSGGRLRASAGGASRS